MRFTKGYIVFAIGMVIVFLAAQPIKNITLEFPDYWPAPVYKLDANPLTEDGVLLGRKLFYDPILSRDSTISCASCHLSYTAFTHVDHELSHGINDQAGSRNAMSLVNLAWSTSLLWDGGVHSLDVQALQPITDSLEMGESLERVLRKLNRSSFYPELFRNAFADSITTKNLLNALAQFQLTFISSNSKYDKMIDGAVEFNEQEERGHELFQKFCNSCHPAPLFTNYDFRSNGLAINPTLNDLGRYTITQNPEDSLKFKVPSLRNIQYSYPYMHDGRFRNLKQVVKHMQQVLKIMAIKV